MSLCCLICTDEITKCIYKTPKINPPPPFYATNDFNWKCGLHIDWVVRKFFPISLLPTPPPPPAPVTHSFISLSPSLPLPHLGPPPFLKSPLPITFSPFLLPYMPKICSIALKKKKKKSWKFRYFTSSPEISLSVQNHTFYADVCTPRQYRLRICNQCISNRIAVIFTAHTLWRATFCLNYELTSKKKKSPFFSLLSPSPSLSLFFFFCLSLVRGGSLPPLPPRRYATVWNHKN